MHFDPYEEATVTQAEAALLFSTEEGALVSSSGSGMYRPSLGGGGMTGGKETDDVRGIQSLRDPIPGKLVYNEATAGFVAFCMEPEIGQDIFCLTGQECLVYLRRPNP